MQANPASLPVARPELDTLIKQIGWRRRRAQVTAALQIGFGLSVLAALCAWLLSDSGQAWLMALDGVNR